MPSARPAGTPVCLHRSVVCIQSAHLVRWKSDWTLGFEALPVVWISVVYGLYGVVRPVLLVGVPVTPALPVRQEQIGCFWVTVCF